MYTAPVSIGDGCWIGSHVTICPGVTTVSYTHLYDALIDMLKNKGEEK